MRIGKVGERWVRRAGRTALLLPLMLASSLTAGVVSYSITPLGSNNYHYDFTVSGMSFLANEELDIRFDPASFQSLSNGVAGNAFHLVLLQPNNPPGTFGDYSALALVNNPSLAAGFHVDVVFRGTGTPGALPYFINQYDSSGNCTGCGALIATIDSGITTAAAVPEPATWSLAIAGLLGAGVWRVRRRR